MLKVLHLSDIHLGSGFSHGHINPATGLNTRLEDFIQSLRLCIDRAIQEPADVVLFGGDAFPDATPPPYVQEAFAAEFRRLADAHIPTVLLVGNHDQHSQGSGGASLCIYRTLAVPGFIVGDRLGTHLIPSANGDLQIITLPWLTRSTLLTRPETEGLSLEAINLLLLKKLQPILEAEIRSLDPQLPTILLGHLMADRATFGAEKTLSVGKGFTIPLALINRPEFDYIALGHVHKHQNLNPHNNPPIVYPGSIERVDFGEEKEDKGYIWLEIGKGKVNWQFCPLPARPFKTIKVDVTEAEDPQAELLMAIAKTTIDGAVVRLIYQIRSEQLEQIDNRKLQEGLKSSHSYTIRPELVSQLARPRLPELGVGSALDPLVALKTYLENKKDIKELMPDLMEAAEHLLHTNGDNWLEAVED
ncbi:MULTISPECIES: exonuclease subunit SbcD [unclassified Synechocystis]|uniref:exonuclease subunit SbcD n=1 Tax=unclassified Synechocystis TaxID=2640012 RepID=UPI000429BEDC|nr:MULTISPECIES: exonuclease subunit SbcD [unclassified Synechocystis]AIE73109.1 Exonuclease SbcD [Synechocystis sp. PCC 6714]MCT0254368.1 exonuclease subunit SbcD [Synechocystis sp. CS-94]